MAKTGKAERVFQKDLVKKLKKLYPESIVLKMDSGHIQGIPDLLILEGERWAALECKKNRTAHHQPNQDYYVEKMDGMSFARFIYPENEKEVLDALQRSLRSEGKACDPGSEQVPMA